MPGAVSNQKGNDLIYTPDNLALALVQHFNPSGLILEPCAGKGAFIRAFKHECLKYKWCELAKGRDFLQYQTNQKISWIITNPPFSKISKFLIKSISLKPKNIVFLCYLTAFTVKYKLDILTENDYSIKELVFINNQKRLQKEFGWKQSGFALTAIHMKRMKKKRIIGKYLILTGRFDKPSNLR